MSRQILTPQSIKGLEPREKVYKVRDGLPDNSIKGFGVVVTPRGSKSYFLSYTSPVTGLRTHATLGTFPGDTLAKMRDAAREWRRQIRLGIDPKAAAQQDRDRELRERAELAAAREREARLGTVADMVELYIADLERQGKRSARDVRFALACDIGPALGTIKARDLTTEAVADLHSAIVARGAPVKADYVRSYLATAWKLARGVATHPYWRPRQQAGEVPVFDLGASPIADVQTARAKRPGTRYLSREEVRRVWSEFGEGQALARADGVRTYAPPSPLLRAALRLLIATGQRVEEILGAEWSEFDRDERTWVIPAARRKTGVELLVPLTDLHLAILDQAEAIKTDARLLFPSDRRKDLPVSSEALRVAVVKHCARSGMAPFSPRDLRRTWKTLAGSIGLDLEVRNRIQGHALGDVGSRHYDRWSYLPEKRAGMERWARWLAGLVEGPGDNVVELRAARP